MEDQQEQPTEESEPTLDDLLHEEQLNRTIASRFNKLAAEINWAASKLDVETAKIRNQLARAQLAQLMAPALKKKLKAAKAAKEAQPPEPTPEPPPGRDGCRKAIVRLFTRR